MKSAFYDWMKNLAVYYVVFCMILNLSPDEKYVRYFRYVMGLFLISILCTPVISFFSDYGEFIENFQNNVWMAEQEMENQTNEMSGIDYIKDACQTEIEEVIEKDLEGLTGAVLTIDISLDQELQVEKITIIMNGVKDDSVIEAVKTELEQKYGICEEAIQFLYQESGNPAVGSHIVNGNSFGSIGDAG